MSDKPLPTRALLSTILTENAHMMFGILGPTVHVYVIGESSDGPIKIGIGDNPTKRLNQLQIGNPRNLELYHSFFHPAAANVESWLHRRFHASLIHGEWFNTPVTAVVAAAELAIIAHAHGELPDFVRAPNLREIDDVLERYCSSCGRWLPVVPNFSRSKAKKHGFQSRCKSCTLERQRKYQNDPVNRAKHNMNELLRKRRLRAAKRQPPTLFVGHGDDTL